VQCPVVSYHAVRLRGRATCIRTAVLARAKHARRVRPSQPLCPPESKERHRAYIHRTFMCVIQRWAEPAAVRYGVSDAAVTNDDTSAAGTRARRPVSPVSDHTIDGAGHVVAAALDLTSVRTEEPAILCRNQHRAVAYLHAAVGAAAAQGTGRPVSPITDRAVHENRTLEGRAALRFVQQWACQ
jgi:hypothetical protein